MKHRACTPKRGGGMKIQVHHIPSSGLTLNYKKKASEFEALKGMVAAGECRFDDPMSIDLEITPEKDFLDVAGCLSATATLACSRCLGTYDLSLNHRFKLTYSQRIPNDLQGGDALEAEFTAEQIGVVFFKGEEIDFTDAIQEQIVMALPYKALCSDACKGLCPHCGADLNRDTCQCDGRPVSGPFDVLKNLKLPSG